MSRVYLNRVFLFHGFSLIAGRLWNVSPAMEGTLVYIHCDTVIEHFLFKIRLIPVVILM